MIKVNFERFLLSLLLLLFKEDGLWQSNTEIQSTMLASIKPLCCWTVPKLGQKWDSDRRERR